MESKLNELWAKVKDDWCYPLSEGVYRATESPIEQLLLLGLLSNLACFDIEYLKDGAGFKELFTAYNGYWKIEPQVDITPKIRVDFLILIKEYPHLKIVVECDGHDFHEKTKEQARRDKSRDRELVKLGFTILHYTGSEIYNNPEKCYQDIEELSAMEYKK